MRARLGRDGRVGQDVEQLQRLDVASVHGDLGTAQGDLAVASVRLDPARSGGLAVGDDLERAGNLVRDADLVFEGQTGDIAVYFAAVRQVLLFEYLRIAKRRRAESRFNGDVIDALAGLCQPRRGHGVAEAAVERCLGHAGECSPYLVEEDRAARAEGSFEYVDEVFHMVDGSMW